MNKFILWNYERGTWQYDLFCGLIVLFIFLTPKIWFESREKLATQTSRLIVKAEDFSADENVLTKRIQTLSGISNAEVLEWHENKNERGEVISYAVEFR